ncbi:MAG TPA: cob(I)yrinic acid a,c-diamide adenosyltransferase [Polyangiaceae bacterium]|nr:cob(I)yrinic acid a,c-diamide adenosyltransferase [Polyangiaceae bacterium]
MKIYTKTGDDGQTGLYGGTRVSKADVRVHAYGELDELNSLVGLARTQPLPPDTDPLLERIQSELFDLGAELATRPGKELSGTAIGQTQIQSLERAIDAAEQQLSPLTAFILPGGAPAAAHLHVARTVCRRAERAIVALSTSEPVRAEVIHYVNRLSDLLFVLARLANHDASIPDVPWVARSK